MKYKKFLSGILVIAMLSNLCGGAVLNFEYSTSITASAEISDDIITAFANIGFTQYYVDIFSKFVEENRDKLVYSQFEEMNKQFIYIKERWFSPLSMQLYNGKKPEELSEEERQELSKHFEQTDIDYIINEFTELGKHMNMELSFVRNTDGTYSIEGLHLPRKEANDKVTKPERNDKTTSQAEIGSVDIVSKGDVNGDKTINVTDIAMVASHIKGIKPLEDKSVKAADVNDDGNVNVTDIAMIAAHIKGIKALDDKSSDQSETDDIGEIYYAPTQAEHIAVSEDGITMYADNEVLVVAKEGVSKSQIETLAKKYNAKIVGCIEKTGDYQWKFNNVKTIKSLDEIASKIKNNENIEDAYPNYVAAISENTVDENIVLGSQWIGDMVPLNDLSTDNPNDNNGRSWGIEMIHAPEAWKYMNENKNNIDPIKVGLLDGGFNENHEDLDFANDGIFYQNGKNGTSLFSNLQNSRLYKMTHHGSHVAGTMAANGTNTDNNGNGIGINGVYPYGEGRLYGVSTSGMRQYDENEDAWMSAMTQKIAISELILRNVKVINQSQGFNWQQFFETDNNGNYKNTSDTAKQLRKLYADTDALYQGFTNGDSYSQQKVREASKYADFLNRAIKLNYDFVIVSAAGNTHARDSQFNSYNCLIPNNDVYKDVYDRIIVVGAVNPNYSICDFSDIGNRVDVFAPGSNIWSSYSSVYVSGTDANGNDLYAHYNTRQEEYKALSGTSMASPHVAGVCANVWSVYNGLSGKSVKDIVTHALLTRTVADNEEIISPYTSPDGNSKGIVDCQKAVEEAVNRKNNGNGNSNQDKMLGIIEGWVYEADSNGNGDNTKPIEDAIIKVYDQDSEEVTVYAEYDKDGNRLDEIKTDNKGHYEFFAYPGTYSVTASKTGYKSATINNITVEREQVNYAEWLVLANNNGSSDSKLGDDQSGDDNNDDYSDLPPAEMYEEILDEIYIGLNTDWSDYEEGDRTDYLERFGRYTDEVAYMFKDLNRDGIQELLILKKKYSSETWNTEDKIVELYSYVNGNPVRVLWTHDGKNDFYLADNDKIYREQSGAERVRSYTLYDFDIEMFSKKNNEYIVSSNSGINYTHRDGTKEKLTLDEMETKIKEWTPKTELNVIQFNKYDSINAGGLRGDELKHLVAVGSEDSCYDWIYDDFDGDGNKEGFAVFVKENWNGKAHALQKISCIDAKGHVMFSKEINSRDYIENLNKLNILEYDGKRFITLDVHHSLSNVSKDTSYIFGVVNGNAYELKISGVVNKLHINDEGVMCNTGYNKVEKQYIAYDIPLKYDKTSHEFIIE